MMVAALVMFLVMLMGLLGYTADEVQRRSKEIAIRKVNGAEATGILELLGRDILWVAVPAVVVGVCASAYVNGLWMDIFSARVSAGQPAGHLGLRAVAHVAHCQRESRLEPEKRVKAVTMAMLRRNNGFVTV